MLLVLLLLVALGGQTTPSRTPEVPMGLDHWQAMVTGPTFEADGPLIRLSG